MFYWRYHTYSKTKKKLFFVYGTVSFALGLLMATKALYKRKDKIFCVIKYAAYPSNNYLAGDIYNLQISIIAQYFLIYERQLLFSL